MSPLQVGPFMLKTEFVIVILSVFAGYIGLRIRLIGASPNETTIKDKLVNSMIMWVMIWKLSFILFDPMSLIMAPMSLFYFDGGEKGLWLGGMVSGIYLWLSSMNSKISLGALIDYVSIAWLCGFAAYHLLLLLLQHDREWAFHLAAMVITIALSTILFMQKKRGDLSSLLQILLWFSLGQVLSSFLNEERARVLMGFSMSQLVFSVLSCMFLGLAHIVEKKRKVKVKEWRM